MTILYLTLNKHYCVEGKIRLCVCVCVSVYLPENEDLVPTSYIETKRGRPRIGEIVQMVANSTCIHMRMC